ncbi:MAG: hypothetical protein D6768_11695 [Chloroflexi bacterium]|nr:MAG: hypothetical protein D6768_11695 [Chloroflexota bacterium]
MSNQPGYVYHPSTFSPELGHAAVDVFLTHSPADRFFDAASAEFKVGEGGAIKYSKIVHPWQSGQQLRVVAGHFSLTDHSGNTVQGYSLGGDLAISTEGDVTLCRLTSTAPVFNLQDDPGAVGRVLVGELESLIARRQAAWGLDDAGFNNRLTGVDPFQFFLASVAKIDDRLKNFSGAAPNTRLQAVKQTVRKIIETLKNAGKWPASPPQLDEIL